MITIPLGLKHALESGECVLFIGAGVGDHLLDSNGLPAPKAGELALELADKFNVATTDYDLQKVASYIALTKRPELENYIKRRLSDLKPDSIFQWLFTLRWRAIFTTNYDNSILQSYDLLPGLKQKPIPVTTTTQIVNYDNRIEVPVYYLHGAVFGEAKSALTITRDDYTTFQERRRMDFELLKKEFITSTIVYVGYGNRDSDWDLVLSEIIAEFARTSSPMPISYRIAPSTDAIEKDILKSKNIFTLDCSLKEFQEAGQATLVISDLDSDKVQKAKQGVPSDLLPAFERNPVPVLRLLNSWTYLNQESFSEGPNIEDFLQGDRPNWSLVAHQQIFERDIEDEIYDILLDYAANDTTKLSVNIVLSPAGYGVTTLLMALAARLVSEHGGTILSLRVGEKVLEGDIEFAIATFPSSKLFFFIDNAPENANVLSSIIDRLKNTNKAALFLMGARLNEWRQARVKPRAKEFALEPLSDPEIGRLLDYLSEHNALNQLESLDRDLQFAVIKQRHRKELLVAMREATEGGKSFDAILEGEFYGIGTPEARRLYLAVCCFYQHGALVVYQEGN